MLSGTDQLCSLGYHALLIFSTTSWIKYPWLPPLSLLVVMIIVAFWLLMVELHWLAAITSLHIMSPVLWSPWPADEATPELLNVAGAPLTSTFPMALVSSGPLHGIYNPAVVGLLVSIIYLLQHPTFFSLFIPSYIMCRATQAFLLCLA